MEYVQVCPRCRSLYNEKVNCPAALECGHYLCLNCVEDLLSQGGPFECPTCRGSQVPASIGVHCSRHSSVIMRAFCVGHMEGVCMACGHPGTSATCVTKDFVEDAQEISYVVLREIVRRSRDLTESMKTPELGQAIEQRFQNQIGTNIQLLERIKGLLLAPHSAVAGMANVSGQPLVGVPVGPQQYFPAARSLPTQAPPHPLPPQAQPRLPPKYPEGIPLSPPQLCAGLQYLVRFPRLLPQPGPIEKENKCWYYNFAKNQVEAVTMAVFDSCRLVAVGIANPISLGDVAVVESILLYNGNTATGNPIAVHQGYEQLHGGNQLLTYVYLSSPFNISAYSPVTLKIKLVSPPSSYSIPAVRLYSGNPHALPDVWTGTDGLPWNFEETEIVEPNEMVNGQNNLNGPILVLIYQH